MQDELRKRQLQEIMSEQVKVKQREIMQSQQNVAYKAQSVRCNSL